MIKFVKMNEKEFEEFKNYAIPDYAEDMVKAGHWSEEEALKKSETQFSLYLTKGLDTENSYLYNIIDEKSEKKVGVIWLIISKTPKSADGFIADIMINEEYRGKGYGKITMCEIEKKAKELGANRMILHVFGFNKIARRLYKKVGYEPISIQMARKI